MLAKETLTTQLYNNQTFVSPTTKAVNKYYGSRQVIKERNIRKLKKVFIDFTLEDRHDINKHTAFFSDIVGVSGTLQGRLKFAELFDLRGELIKKVEFNYSYFNAPP